MFRQVDNDEKLRDQTVALLDEAIIEANRRMCADETPICEGTATLCGEKISSEDCIVNGKVCNNLNTATAQASAYNQITGYCEYDKPDAGCADGFNLRMKDDKCYAPPRCSGGLSAVPRHTKSCPNGVPAQNHTRDGDTSVYELCRQLHAIINHKDQTGVGGAAVTDLANTCANSTDACVTALSETNPDACSGSGNDLANMVLPNGARLYNLSCLGRAAGTVGCPDVKNIYIRFDKMDVVKFLEWDKLAKYEVYK